MGENHRRGTIGICEEIIEFVTDRCGVAYGWLVGWLELWIRFPLCKDCWSVVILLAKCDAALLLNSRSSSILWAQGWTHQAQAFGE